MKSSFVGAALVVGAFGLACGGARGPAQIPADVVPVPAPVPEVAPAPAPAPVPVAASRCPEGVYAAPLWQGEYPGPIVHVTAAFTTPGRADACDGAPKGPCTVAPGLYHPWADVEARFATLRPIVKFRLRGPWTATTDEGATVSLKAGDEVEVLAYFGEGFCGYRVRGSTLSSMCPELMALPDDTSLFEEIPHAAFTQIQVLGVTCREGHTAWIDVDDALIALPEVEEGVVVEYGQVGPAPK